MKMLKTLKFWTKLVPFLSLWIDMSKSYAWSFEADNVATSLPNRTFSTDPKDVIFYSFTDPSLPPRKIDDMDPSGAIDCNLPTVCLIHGQDANAFTEPGFPGNALKAYLEAYRGSHNIISVDWRLLASTDCPSGEKVACLQAALDNTKVVGERMGEFFINLNKNCGLQFDKVHLVAHSLSGPVPGFAGDKVIKATGGEKFWRITALEHSNFLSLGTVGRQLRANDATCVDVHHTSAHYGSVLPLGTCDFYINGGVTQPACSEQLTQKANLICDHAMSTVYWVRSIKTNPADRKCVCKSELLFNLYPLYNCCYEKIPYGEHNDCKSKGIFYVRLPA